MTVDLFRSVEPQLETDMIPAVIILILFWSTDLQAQSVSPPAEHSVRLVNGTTSCSGTVEVFYRGEWSGLCSSWWSMMVAKVVCRELDCGNVVAESRGPLFEHNTRGVRLSSRCSGNEYFIRQCDNRGGPGYCFGEYYHHVICSESVRLVDGAGLCSGRVEVKSDQSWASVCEADFDRQDAEVVCGELGCGAPAALQGGLYGGGEGQTSDKEFQCKGNESLLLDCDTSNRENNTCLPGNAVGLTCSEPDDVRLVGGGSRCAGGVERYDQGEWRTVGTLSDVKDIAAVVCRQLGCGSTVSVPPGNPARGFEASCSGSESSLRECPRSYDRSPGLTVICSESVRLVDGAGLCSGRVEVKSDQSWASVCEADFDRQDAEVVCGELGCGAPAALQGGLYGEGEGQTWDKEFQCKGKESLLLDCDTSDRENNICLPGNAVGLTCSEPDDVRLVGGGSRCAGVVERYDQGEWRTVGSDWNQRDVAAVVCRQLGCGSTVSVLPGNTTRGFGVSCSGSESSLRECSRSYDLSPGLTVICSESVRLVDGAGLCSGRVEVKSNQSWASVCEADFDRQDAEVVCGELGCGAPAALQGGLYGEGEGQTWDNEFQCKGKESLLLDCDTSDRENNICLPGNAVGLTCSEPDDVRLVGGGSRCAGGVEWFDQGEWRTVGSDWDQRDVAAVVCRQLGCGSAVSVLPGNTTGAHGVVCDGTESALRECVITFDRHSGLTVICSSVQPEIFLTDSMGGVSRGHQGPEVFRGYSFTITCSTQPQYPGGSFLLTFTGSNRTQTQPAVNHSAAFLFPAADDSHQGNYRCVYDNYGFSHNFSSESELLSLTITASPLPAFIIRHVVVLLILLTAITTSYLYYKPTRRQKRVNRVSSMDLYVNAMEMVSLSSRAEAGPGEERAAQGTE
ncbi:deleted in malignant brain tumors 1 protein [Salmo trutta]|uniref:deleted in malignant brain tumors 1 protein n=1 Tax=Salmo trutta TaxID=8032 RepID=UPI00113278EC|nr:deleted in malignant brain tumors 1 protein-like [Salmo trutta]XP_029602296.1 deleted in malignant brain tumors 1 protein-like [Salmo trutta]